MKPRLSLRSGARRRTYECAKCGVFRTDQSRLYLEHLRDVHKKSLQIFQCDCCSYACPNRCKLLRHRNTVHSDKAPITLGQIVPEAKNEHGIQRLPNHSKHLAAPVLGQPVPYTVPVAESLAVQENVFASAATTLSLQEKQMVLNKVQHMILGTKASETTLNLQLSPKPRSSDATSRSWETNNVTSDENCNVLDLTCKSKQVEPPHTLEEDAKQDTTTKSLQDLSHSPETTDVTSRDAGKHSQLEQTLSKLRSRLCGEQESNFFAFRSNLSSSIYENVQDTEHEEDREVEAINSCVDMQKSTLTGNSHNRNRESDHELCLGTAKTFHTVGSNPVATYNYTNGEENNAFPLFNDSCPPIEAMSRMQHAIDLAWKSIVAEVHHTNATRAKRKRKKFLQDSANSKHTDARTTSDDLGKKIVPDMYGSSQRKCYDVCNSDAQFVLKRQKGPTKIRTEISPPLINYNKETEAFRKEEAYANYLENSSSLQFTPPFKCESSVKQSIKTDAHVPSPPIAEDQVVIDVSESRGESSSESDRTSSENAYSYIKALAVQSCEGLPLFGCRLCRYQARQKWKVAHHVRSIHLRHNFYKCQHCSFVCKRKTEWTVHLVRHSAKKVHACTECGYKTVMKRNFVRHMVHHTERRAASCHYCSYSSSGEAAIQRHMSEFHASPQRDKERFEAQLAFHRASQAAAVRSMDTQRRLVGSSPSVANNNNSIIAHNNTQGEASDKTATRFQGADIPRNPFSLQPPEAHGDSSAKRRSSRSLSNASSSSGGSSSASGTFNCPDCGTEFRSRSNLRSHMISHSTEVPWKCHLCSLRYKRKADLSTHMRSKHNMTLPSNCKPQTEIKTEVPDFSYTSLTVQQDDQPLDLCVKTEPGVKQVQKSAVSFGQFDGFQDYDDPEDVEMSECQPLDLSNKLATHATLKCSHCSYIAKWPGDLRRHCMSMHAISHRFKCRICYKKFKNVSDLNVHMKMTHKQNKTRNSVLARQRSVPNRHAKSLKGSLNNNLPKTQHRKRLQCKECDFIAKYRKELERHISIHTGHKPWACLFCDYTSHWKGDMKRHIDKHHQRALASYGDVYHMLQQCYYVAEDDQPVLASSPGGESSGASVSPTPSLSKSNTQQDPEFRYKIKTDGTRKAVMRCPYCPFENELASVVKAHMIVHGDLKRFMCPHCGKRSNWVWHIRKHIHRDHAGAKNIDVVQMTVDEAQNTLDEYLIRVNTGKVCSAAEMALNLENNKDAYVLLKAEINGPSSVKVERLSPPSRRMQISPGTPSPAKKLRPFKCSECGRRSNWRWDLNKHIRMRHPHAQVITLSEEEARSTIHEIADRQTSAYRTRRKSGPLEPEYGEDQWSEGTVSYLSDSQDSTPPPDLTPLKAQDLPTKPLTTPPKLELAGRQRSPDQTVHDYRHQTPEYVKHLVAGKFRPFKCSICAKRSNWKWDINKHMRISHSGQIGHVITLNEEEARDTYHEATQVKYRGRLGRKRQNWSGSDEKPPSDIKVIKPFQCSVCLYRSNFKSDISRHLGRQHAGVSGARVVTLEPKIARETLRDYEAKHCTSSGSLRRKRQPPAPISGLELAKALKDASSEQKSTMTQDHRAQLEASNGSNGVGADVSSEQSSHSSSRPPSACDSPSLRFTGYSASPSKRDIYLCKKCSFYTTSQKSIINHYRVHGEPGVFRCTLCGECSDYKHSIVRHALKRHGVENYQAADQFVEQRDFYTIIHGDTAELCQITGESVACETDDQRSVSRSPSRDKMLDQSHDHDVDTNSSSTSSRRNGFVVTMYRCKICGPMKSSDLRYCVVRHVRRVHIDVTNPDEYVEEFETVKPALSPDKIQRNASASSLTDDTRESHGVGCGAKGAPLSEAQRYQARKYHCEVCPYRTTKPGHLKLHMEQHVPNPQNKLKCQYCPYYATQSHIIRNHEQLHLKYGKEARQNNENRSPAKPVSSSPFVTPRSPVKVPRMLPKYACDKCPFMSNMKNKFLYHKQFHRPKRAAQEKCELCPYWIRDRRGLKAHMRVHEPDDLQRDHNVPPAAAPASLQSSLLRACDSNSSLLLASPCRSDLSDMSIDDIIESAEMKQQIIASKVKSVAITPHKVRLDAASSQLGSKELMSSYVLNPNQQSISLGLYRKFYKCRFCPWTNVRHRNLVLHERMHGRPPTGEGGKELFGCRFCDYRVANKGLLSLHQKVHSEQYCPGVDIIDDVEQSAPEVEKQAGKTSGQAGPGDSSDEEDDEEEDEEKSGVLTSLDQQETKNRIMHHKNSTRLDMHSFPNKCDYYIKCSDGRHILERAVLKKWCCEKCPYATMKRSQFEKHVSLHASRQKYICQYCDYSVPGYHLLIQHEKLHRMPNPNLLSVQSLANLTQLPEIPADVAASTQYASDRADPGIHDHIRSLYEHTTMFAEPKRLYHCDRCPYANVRRDHILAHLKFHMIRSEFKCPYCDYSVSKSHLMTQHIKVHFILPGSEMSSEPPPETSSAKSNATNEEVNDSFAPTPISTDVDDGPVDYSTTKIKLSTENSQDIIANQNRIQNNERMSVDTEMHENEVNLEVKEQNGCGSLLNRSKNPEDLDNYIDGVKRLSSDNSSFTLGQSLGTSKLIDCSPNSQYISPESKDASTSPLNRKRVASGEPSQTDALLVCRYCDRTLPSLVKLTQHEERHLMGVIAIT